MNNISSSIRFLAEEIKKETIPDSKVFNLKKLTPEDVKEMDVKVNIQASNILNDRYILAFIVEAGLKDDFLKVLKQGKAGWNKFWSNIKDKSLQLAIKGLKTIEQVKEFQAKHPNLKWALLSGIILGYLILPPDALAQVIDAPTAKDLANHLSVHVAPNAIQITADPGWIQNVIMRTVQEGSTPEKINADLIHNLAGIIWEKSKAMGLGDDTRRELAKTIFQAVFKGGAKLLSQYGIKYIDDIDPFSSLP
jgi:hypothetical protein